MARPGLEPGTPRSRTRPAASTSSPTLRTAPLRCWSSTTASASAQARQTVSVSASRPSPLRPRAFRSPSATPVAPRSGCASSCTTDPSLSRPAQAARRGCQPRGPARAPPLLGDDVVAAMALDDLVNDRHLMTRNDEEALEARPDVLIRRDRQRQRRVAPHPAALAHEHLGAVARPATTLDRLVDAPPIDLRARDAPLPRRIGTIHRRLGRYRSLLPHRHIMARPPCGPPAGRRATASKQEQRRPVARCGRCQAKAEARRPWLAVSLRVRCDRKFRWEL